MVTLQKITEETLYKALNLSVTDTQKSFVASNEFSLAEAWMYGDIARPFAVFADTTMVGFFMGSVEPDKNKYTVWRLMIDQRYQGKGYGRAALTQAIAYLVNEGAKEVYLSYEPENVTAAALYKSMGFVLTGEMEEDEVVAKLVINAD